MELRLNGAKELKVYQDALSKYEECKEKQRDNLLEPLQVFLKCLDANEMLYLLEDNYRYFYENKNISTKLSLPESIITINEYIGKFLSLKEPADYVALDQEMAKAVGVGFYSLINTQYFVHIERTFGIWDVTKIEDGKIDIFRVREDFEGIKQWVSKKCCSDGEQGFVFADEPLSIRFDNGNCSIYAIPEPAVINPEPAVINPEPAVFNVIPKPAMPKPAIEI